MFHFSRNWRLRIFDFSIFGPHHTSQPLSPTTRFCLKSIRNRKILKVRANWPPRSYENTKNRVPPIMKGLKNIFFLHRSIKNSVFYLKPIFIFLFVKTIFGLGDVPPLTFGNQLIVDGELVYARRINSPLSNEQEHGYCADTLHPQWRTDM